MLSGAVEDMFDSLKTGGRLSIITFHSLEDRIVKEKFRRLGYAKKMLEYALNYLDNLGVEVITLEVRPSNLNAIDYYGMKITYKDLLAKVDKCAKSFYNFGIRYGDVVTISTPNSLSILDAIISI